MRYDACMKVHEIGWNAEWGGVRLGAVLDLARVPCPDMRLVKQVHGSLVLGDDSWQSGMEADGMVTKASNVALVIKTADCVPVHIVAPGQVATIHAGWRGLRGGIMEKTLPLFPVQETLAVIGPCICSTHYEVDADLYADWVADEPDVATHLYPSGNHPTKRLLDLQALVTHKLSAAGVPLDKIHTVDKCTFGSRQLPSYRRDRTHLRIYNYTILTTP